MRPFGMWVLSAILVSGCIATGPTPQASSDLAVPAGDPVSVTATFSELGNLSSSGAIIEIVVAAHTWEAVSYGIAISGDVELLEGDAYWTEQGDQAEHDRILSGRSRIRADASEPVTVRAWAAGAELPWTFGAIDRWTIRIVDGKATAVEAPATTHEINYERSINGRSQLEFRFSCPTDMPYELIVTSDGEAVHNSTALNGSARQGQVEQVRVDMGGLPLGVYRVEVRIIPHLSVSDNHIRDVFWMEFAENGMTLYGEPPR